MPESYEQHGAMSSRDRDYDEEDDDGRIPSQRSHTTRSHIPRSPVARRGEFRAPEFRPPQGGKPKSHFEIDDKITIRIDYDFAVALGQFLLEADIVDKRFKSLGHHLCALDQDQT